MTQFAVTIAVAGTALPYLSRPLHRLVSSLVTLHLAVGSPLGLPSTGEVTDWIADLGVPVEGIVRAPPGLGGGEAHRPRPRRPGCSTPTWPAGPWCTCSVRGWTR